MKQKITVPDFRRVSHDRRQTSSVLMVMQTVLLCAIRVMNAVHDRDLRGLLFEDNGQALETAHTPASRHS